MRYDRGGHCLKTGKIGRANIVRQQLLLPGEILRPSVRGEVKLTALRERESIRIHARIDAFVQPLRWLWPDWPAYVTEGPATTKTVPTHTLTATAGEASDLGVGGDSANTIHRWFHDAPLRVWNEWYKWPEAPDETAWQPDGLPLVNLATSWSRIQTDQQLIEGDTSFTLPTDRELDVRRISEQQARYRLSMEREWLSKERYIAFLREAWNAQASREVDKVPLRLRGAEVGVDPMNLYATDADGLGSTASFYNFHVDHRFGRFAAPEHMIVTYILCVRFAPVAEDEINPTAATTGRDWASIVGEPGLLAAQRPVPVTVQQVAAISSGSATLGYLPAGWQWRARWNCVGSRLDLRDSFPVIRSISARTAAQLRDASRIGEPFLSKSLGDYLVDLWFSEDIDSPIPGPRSSIMGGVGDSGRGSAYPYPMEATVV